MLENVKTISKLYEDALESLCQKYPDEKYNHYLYFRNKLEGVLDMLAYDISLSCDEYSNQCQEIRAHFEGVYKKY